MKCSFAWFQAIEGGSVIFVYFAEITTYRLPRFGVESEKWHNILKLCICLYTTKCTKSLLCQNNLLEESNSMCGFDTHQSENVRNDKRYKWRSRNRNEWFWKWKYVGCEISISHFSFSTFTQYSLSLSLHTFEELPKCSKTKIGHRKLEMLLLSIV